MQVLEFDTVIVGSGLAGLTSALHASIFGKVAIITKSGLDISNSYNAQGGIAAAIGEDDSTTLHKLDSLEAGRGLCDHDAMDILVSEGRNCVIELIELGMPFDTQNGKIVLGLEGGHGKRRILHAEGDATGKVLTRFMLERVKNTANIQAFENTSVVDCVPRIRILQPAMDMLWHTRQVRNLPTWSLYNSTLQLCIWRTKTPF